jgi:hypothetical protein
MKKNFRFGYRIGGNLVPNFGVIVFDMPKDLGDIAIAAANTIKTAFIVAGRGDIADKFVAEFRV